MARLGVRAPLGEQIGNDLLGADAAASGHGARGGRTVASSPYPRRMDGGNASAPCGRRFVTRHEFATRSRDTPELELEAFRDDQATMVDHYGDGADQRWLSTRRPG